LREAAVSRLVRGMPWLAAGVALAALVVHWGGGVVTANKMRPLCASVVLVVGHTLGMVTVRTLLCCQKTHNYSKQDKSGQ